MAQINAIITEGFGSFAGVQYIVTLGFLGGSTPPPTVTVDTHDYPVVSYRDLKKHKARLKRLEDARQAKLVEKTAARDNLRAEIEGIINPQEAAEEAQAVAIETGQLENNPVIAQPSLADMRANIDRLNAEIAQIMAPIIEARKQYQRARDERDIQAIMALLNAEMTQQ